MASTPLRPARVGETRVRTWTISTNGVAQDLSAFSAVRLYYRWQPGTWSILSTLDFSPMLAVSNAAAGEITLTPTAAFFSQAGTMTLHTGVVGSGAFSVPDTDEYTIQVFDGG